MALGLKYGLLSRVIPFKIYLSWLQLVLVSCGGREKSHSVVYIFGSFGIMGPFRDILKFIWGSTMRPGPDNWTLQLLSGLWVCILLTRVVHYSIYSVYCITPKIISSHYHVLIIKILNKPFSYLHSCFHATCNVPKAPKSDFFYLVYTVWRKKRYMQNALLYLIWFRTAYVWHKYIWHACPHNGELVFWSKFVNSVKKTITKTYLYNFDPLKPHFYIVKLGFTGVYIIFIISA